MLMKHATLYLIVRFPCIRTLRFFFFFAVSSFVFIQTFCFTLLPVAYRDIIADN